MFYPSSENKGADQLRGYPEADLCLCFRICKSRFSHDAALIIRIVLLFLHKIIHAYYMNGYILEPPRCGSGAGSSAVRIL